MDTKLVEERERGDKLRINELKLVRLPSLALLRKCEL